MHPVLNAAEALGSALWKRLEMPASPLSRRRFVFVSSLEQGQVETPAQAAIWEIQLHRQ